MDTEESGSDVAVLMTSGLVKPGPAVARPDPVRVVVHHPGAEGRASRHVIERVEDHLAVRVQPRPSDGREGGRRELP